MKKMILKGLTGLLFVFLIGTVLISCGPVFDVGGNNTGGGGGNNTGGGNNGGGGTPPPRPPADGYESVNAMDARDLATYLADTETSYDITLTEIENRVINLPGNITIVKPMRITGASGNVYTINSNNPLNLQEDLEFQYCGYTGPLNIGANRTLTMGRDSVLELKSGGSNPIRTGSQVRLTEGAGIGGESTSADFLFTAVEKLTVNGRVSLKNDLTVRGTNAVLHIESGGQLLVEPGATLILDNNLKELRLDGNIVIDRTGSSPLGALAFTGNLTIVSLLEKITGETGSLTIENDTVEMYPPFQFGANTTIKLSGAGINMGKRVSSGIGGVINTTSNLTMPKDKSLVVTTGTDLNVYNTLILAGGTLDVAGNVNVTENGQITLNAENRLTATPKGSVVIGANGTVTIDAGTFKDESVTWDKRSFTFPSYGPGALLVKNTGLAVLGTGTGDKLIGESSQLLRLTDANSTMTIRTAGSTPEFTLRGTGTLSVPQGGLLEGRFVVAGGAALTITGNTLAVRAPSQLTGTTTPSASRLIVEAGSKVEIYATANASEPTSFFNPKTYTWSGSWD